MAREQSTDSSRITRAVSDRRVPRSAPRGVVSPHTDERTPRHRGRRPRPEGERPSLRDSLHLPRADGRRVGIFDGVLDTTNGTGRERDGSTRRPQLPAQPADRLVARRGQPVAQAPSMTTSRIARPPPGGESRPARSLAELSEPNSDRAEEPRHPTDSSTTDGGTRSVALLARACDRTRRRACCRAPSVDSRERANGASGSADIAGGFSRIQCVEVGSRAFPPEDGITAPCP